MKCKFYKTPKKQHNLAFVRAIIFINIQDKQKTPKDYIRHKRRSQTEGD